MGCPVLSYDVRYGPNEIINHGENGYLIEENHIEQLAHRMIDIVEHPLRNVRNQEKLTYSASKELSSLTKKSQFKHLKQ